MTDYKPLRIGDLPRDLQPREMLKRAGARHASDDTLLAVILRVGVPREIAKGQRDEVALQPNLVFEAALKEGTKSIIVAHNHPSGDPTPSEADVSLTQKLVDAGRIMNIPVVDHLILGVPSEGCSGYFSMAAAELIEFYH